MPGKPLIVSIRQTLGGPAHFKLNFQKYRLFVRLKFYHLKKHRTDRRR